MLNLNWKYTKKIKSALWDIISDFREKEEIKQIQLIDVNSDFEINK